MQRYPDAQSLEEVQTLSTSGELAQAPAVHTWPRAHCASAVQATQAPVAVLQRGVVGVAAQEASDVQPVDSQRLSLHAMFVGHCASAVHATQVRDEVRQWGVEGDELQSVSVEQPERTQAFCRQTSPVPHCESAVQRTHVPLAATQ
jgi:hypothetical protein